MTAIKLKWNKEEFDVTIDDPSVEVFKTQVWTLTQVPVDRQKYLGFPGGMLKDSDDLVAKASKLKPGAKVQLVGTAEGGELKAPAAKTVFEEDLTPEEKARILKEKKVEILPAGIKNLGNTCYMNATLQCLNHVTDLRTSLESYTPPAADARDIDAVLTAQFKGVTQALKSTTDCITPLQFVMALRQRFPRFAEMQNGGYMQQDADECLRGLLTVMSETLKTENGSNRIDELFSFNLKSSLKCLECDEEAPSVAMEPNRVLICHLGTQTEPVSHIHQGVQLSLKEHIEKSSPSLGRNAQYEKTSHIDSLSPYLVVQFARFGFKGANDWAGTSASKVKLIRKCAFSSTFDLFDITSPELKKQLGEGRLKKKEYEDELMEKDRQAKIAASSSSAPADGDVEMKPAEETEDVEMMPADMVDEYDTGYYELVGVVSHKGRTADGGHYVGWIRYKKAEKRKEEDMWVLFDDEDVFDTTFPKMTGQGVDLQGGKADTQIAYINIYKKVTVKVPKSKGQVLGSGEAQPAAAEASESPTKKQAT